MKIEKLIAQLKSLEGQYKDVYIATDAEWNSFGDVEVTIESDSNTIILFPPETFIELDDLIRITK